MRSGIVLFFALLAGFGGFVEATSITWNVGGSGNWDTSTANWTGEATVFTNDGTMDVTFNNTAGGTIVISANMNPKSVTVSAGSGTYIFTGGPIITSGSLSKSGGGELRISCSNSFAGGTTVSGGSLNINNNGAIGTNRLTINGGTVANYYSGTGPTLPNNPMIWNGNFNVPDIINSVNFGNGPVTLNNPISIYLARLVVGGPITGPGGLNLFDVSTTYPGGTGLQLDLYGPVTLSSNQTIKLAFAVIYGAIGDNGNGYGLTLTRPFGSQSVNFRGTNTYSGDTAVSSGLLNIGGNLALQNSALVTSLGGFSISVSQPVLGGLKGSTDLTFVFSSGYGSVSALTLNPLTGHTNDYFGAIANGAAGMKLIKTGAGMQILSGINTYTGGTTISNGTLLVNGSVTGDVSVAGGGFGGTGTVYGAVTYSAGAIGVFSNGPAMTITGSLTLNTNIVHVNLPEGLKVGTYPLATFNPSGSSGEFAKMAYIDSGSAVGTPMIVMGSGTVDLKIVGRGFLMTLR